MNSGDRTGTVLVIRSVPWRRFRRYLKKAMETWPGFEFTVMARQPAAKMRDFPMVKMITYPPAAQMLNMEQAEMAGVGPQSFDVVAIPSYYPHPAPYLNLAEIALRVARKEVAFILSDLSIARVVLEGGESGPPEKEPRFRSSLFELVMGDEAQGLDAKLTVNWMDKSGTATAAGKKRDGGVLLVYHHPLDGIASNLAESLNAIMTGSKYRVIGVNNLFGFPRALKDWRFDAIVLHYTVFYPDAEWFNPEYMEFLEKSGAVKVAVFQDEFFGCQKRFEFLNRIKMNAVFTIVQPEWYDEAYRKHAHVKRLETYLAAYVSGKMVSAARALSTPFDARPVDIGYRGRPVPFFMGRGVYEKYEIAHKFLEQAAGVSPPLVLDISADQANRLYGSKWLAFLGLCKATLGTESGSDLFDFNGEARRDAEKYLKRKPNASFEEVYENAVGRHDGNMQYRSISARHFEAAATRSAQILYEGEYSGIMKPWRHYIPLKKDHSNFDEVIAAFRDKRLVNEIIHNAEADLIESGLYGYKAFVRQLDRVLEEEGVQPQGRKND